MVFTHVCSFLLNSRIPTSILLLQGIPTRNPIDDDCSSYTAPVEELASSCRSCLPLTLSQRRRLEDGVGINPPSSPTACRRLQRSARAALPTDTTTQSAAMNRTVALAAGGAGVLVAFYAIWVASNPKPKVSEEGERAAPAATAEASAAEKQRVAEEKALAGLKAAQERGAKAVTGSPGTGSKPVVTKAGSSSSSSSSSSSTNNKNSSSSSSSSSNDGLPAHTPVMVAYGSQTGNAKAIAQDVFEKLQEMGVTARLSALNDWKKWDPTLAKGTELLICVISTTGNADAPDNCDKFQRFLKRKAHAADMLKGLRFAVLGLGDTNYNEFCYMGRWLDERLDGLGAKRFRPLGCADEATGLEDVVEPWCEALYPSVLKAIESGGGFGGGAEDSAPAAGGRRGSRGG